MKLTITIEEKETSFLISNHGNVTDNIEELVENLRTKLPALWWGKHLPIVIRIDNG